MTALEPGLELEAHLRLCAELGRTADELERARRERRPLATPSFYKVVWSVIIPAGGAILSRPPAGGLDGPDQGHLWHVRRVVLGGLTRATVAAGAADLYVTGSDRGDNTVEPSLVDLVDMFAALPAARTYSNGQVPMRMQDELGVRFTGATPGQTYVAAVLVMDLQEGVAGQEWALS